MRDEKFVRKDAFSDITYFRSKGLASPFPIGVFCAISVLLEVTGTSVTCKRIRIVKRISFNINCTMFTRSSQILGSYLKTSRSYNISSKKTQKPGESSKFYEVQGSNFEKQHPRTFLFLKSNTTQKPWWKL